MLRRGRKLSHVAVLTWAWRRQRAGNTGRGCEWSVNVSGFAAPLHGWLQASAVEEQRGRLGAAAAAVRDLARRREALLSGRLEAARRREVCTLDSLHQVLTAPDRRSQWFMRRKHPSLMLKETTQS